VTVLREGQVVHTGNTAALTAEAIGAWMVGERTRVDAAPIAARGGKTRLQVERIVLGDSAGSVQSSISFEIRAGERVGVAGVGGAGHATLAATIAGLLSPTSGSIRVDGLEITADAFRAQRAGVAFIPDDRADGLSAEHTVAENLFLLRLQEPHFSRYGLRRDRVAADYALPLMRAMNITPENPRLRVGALSGGNQQKVLVARELERNPAVVIAHGPTRGLDLAAAAAVRNALFAAATGGAALLILSSDLDELLALCNRLLVLSSGRIVADLDCRDSPPDAALLGLALAGLPQSTPALSEEILS
jgi:ABC-type uncharacterized transport system ATPase subunit